MGPDTQFLLSLFICTSDASDVSCWTAFRLTPGHTPCLWQGTACRVKHLFSKLVGKHSSQTPKTLPHTPHRNAFATLSVGAWDGRDEGTVRSARSGPRPGDAELLQFGTAKGAPLILNGRFWSWCSYSFWNKGRTRNRWCLNADTDGPHKLTACSLRNIGNTGSARHVRPMLEKRDALCQTPGCADQCVP